MTPSFCFKCTSKTFPFGNLNNQNFNSFINENSQMSESYVGKYINDDIISTLNPPSNLSQLNDLTA